MIEQQFDVKPPKPWHIGKTKDGKPIVLPTRFRIKPSKYNPSAGPMPKNSPHCLKNGLRNDELIKCRSCMWQGQCGKEVKSKE